MLIPMPAFADFLFCLCRILINLRTRIKVRSKILEAEDCVWYRFRAHSRSHMGQQLIFGRLHLEELSDRAKWKWWKYMCMCLVKTLAKLGTIR